jgi:molybdopterin/thiamine biosynthesis adenylyltransferase
MIRYMRQQDLIPADKLPKKLIIIGVGGLGSHAAEKLARIGCPEIILYDPQVIEEVNLGSQAFLNDATGKPKVQAMKEKLALVSEAKVETHQEEFDQQGIYEPSVVICVPDKMDTRKKIWENQIKFNPNVVLYVEARMAGLFGIIYALNPSDPDQITFYEKTLYSSKEAVELPCTARGVDFNCSGIADWIAALVTSYVSGHPYPNEILVDYKNFVLQTKDLDEKK